MRNIRKVKIEKVGDKRSLGNPGNGMLQTTRRRLEGVEQIDPKMNRERLAAFHRISSRDKSRRSVSSGNGSSIAAKTVSNAELLAREK